MRQQHTRIHDLAAILTICRWLASFLLEERLEHLECSMSVSSHSSRYKLWDDGDDEQIAL